MAYASSRDALRELGRDAEFEDDVVHYNYRCWTANEANRNFTSQERQRVLGQSREGVFERHYQFQYDVVLRLSQKSLLQVGGSMLRKWNPSAPSSELTEEQRHIICQDPRILDLRRAKREVMEGLRSLAGTKREAQETYPHLYQRQESISKELSQLRKTLAKDTKETTRKDYFYNASILEVDRQIKQLLSQADPEDRDGEGLDKKEWELPIPKYVLRIFIGQMQRALKMISFSTQGKGLSKRFGFKAKIILAVSDSVDNVLDRRVSFQLFPDRTEYLGDG
ncbi:hypothetical protein TSTA_003170 [Talaromyces stipitatus ATCC 10500]|uniref:Uncharacterized protein n=1 Tax=Talaromyces stipitatus (strain ATCC 10500 / CBS 375.48 / QM 6759 / NRRL 1006) TaxID=441959 RepID=B8MT52_TALSN|nr:uncharacterized protein TSTA_003170 [Talaromyces stipitatus ATCC 10500]EED12255.1 hypothetical protein TSTA_003170 [Talaromyces stipitatus ATCC 10500]